MNKAYIKAVSYYLPENVLNNERIAELFPDWSAEKVANKIGVSERHISGEGETSADMAVKASERLFEEYGIPPSSIDFILLCTQSPDYFLPTSACLIQDRLGIPTTSGAFDFNLGCSGYIYGLAIAKGLICAGIAKNILLITSETYSKFIHPEDKGNRTIFGDASAATLVSTDGFAEIGEFSLGTDGSGSENLIVKTGALREREITGIIDHYENGNPISGDYLYMNGTEIFNFTLESVPKLIEDTLSLNGLKKDDIGLFILHQANRYMMEFIRKKVKIEPEKFFYYLDKVGNTVSSTIPIAIKEAKAQEKLTGDILLAGFGVGYSWGGVSLKCK